MLVAPPEAEEGYTLKNGRINYEENDYLWRVVMAGDGLLVYSLVYMGRNAISGEVEERCENLAELKSIETHKYMDFKCYHNLDGEWVEVGVW